MNTPTYILRGLTKDGAEVFYTGRAGDGWTSTDRKEAFYFRTFDGARARATQFNKYHELHGCWFIAMNTMRNHDAYTAVFDGLVSK